MIRYIDATDSPDRRVDYPEIVEELVTLGFEVIGRVAAHPIEGTNADIAAEFDPVQAQLYLDHCDVPATVLRSPDSTVFVDVSWFWESPSVRFRTELADGSVAETNRRWTFRPGLPLVLEEYWTNFDIDADMAKRSTPHTGRSTLVVKTSSAAEQWERHRDHVAQYSQARSQPPRSHEEVDHYIDLAYRLFEHEVAVEQRTVGLWKPLAIAYGVVGLALMLGVAFAGYPLVGVGLGILFAALTMPVIRMIIGKVRFLPVRWRPSFL